MQKLPRNRKRLTGTDRPDKDRRGIQPGQALTQAPAPPANLSERACAIWSVIAPEVVDLGILTSADLPMLALLAETQATVRELEDTIRDEGFTVETGTGGKKSHPCLKPLETTRGAVTRLLKEFGLSPLSRKFVEKAPAGRSGYNPFDHLDDFE